MNIIQEIYTRPENTGSEFIDLEFADESESEENAGRKWVRCRVCNYKIARQSDKISINKADTHIFKNPSGIYYRLICFSDAPGSKNVTDHTSENTWFSGYSWSISLCRSCNNHLGWHYNSGSGEFYGLIADRLTGI